MPKTFETSVKTNAKGGNFALLSNLLDYRRVYKGPWVETQTLSVSSANVKLIASSVLSGSLAVGTSSTTVQGGIVTAALAGAVGTGATTSITNSLGQILNLVEIRDASTNTCIYDGSFRKIYGLLQSGNGVADGTAIGAAASENLQISFVVFNSSNALALATVNGNIDFRVKRLYALRHTPELVDEDYPVHAAPIYGSEKGAASGVAPLNGSSKVAISYLPVDDVSSDTSNLLTSAQIDTRIANATSGTASALKAPVADITALKALNTTSAVTYPDKVLINVEDTGLYRLDRDSAVAESLPGIVAPTSGSGRWYKMTSSINDHNNLANMQGGTTNEYYHMTSAERTMLQSLVSAGLYTDEKAQDAVNAMMADTDTIDFTYTDATPELKADVKKQMSITSDSSGLKLVNDATSPGNSKYYGTDGSGTKGFFTIASSDPLSIPWVTSTVEVVYSDDLTLIVTDTLKLLNGFVIQDDRGPNKYLNGTLQNASRTGIWASSNSSGALIRGGYIYATFVQTGTAARVYRCATNVDIANNANWTQLTIAGTALGTAATDHIRGYGNSAFWIRKGSTMVPYTLSGTTLTGGTPVTISGSDYASVVVNDSGIYASFATAPLIRKADFSGALDNALQTGSAISTNLTAKFATPNTFYYGSSASSNGVSQLSKISF